MASEKVLIVDDATFEAEVLKADIPVLVDFWAEWCGPCRMVAPILDTLAGEFAGKIKFAKVNVDSSRETAGKYGIRSIPTLIIFKDGEIDDQIIGALPEAKLRQRLTAVL